MSTVFNFVSRGVKVHNLDITWQLYWSMGDNDPEIGRKLRKANDYRQNTGQTSGLLIVSRVGSLLTCGKKHMERISTDECACTNYLFFW